MFRPLREFGSGAWIIPAAGGNLPAFTAEKEKP